MSLRMMRAELLKVRKRRGVLVWTLLLTVGAVVVQYGVLAARHAADPDRVGPAGGLENLGSSAFMLSLLLPIVAVLVGAAVGAGDLEAGVFRDLVVTGRSRVALFAARVGGGLGLLVPVAVVTWALAGIASVALAGGLAAPSLGVILETGAWLLLWTVVMFMLALGVASLSGSRSMTIGVLLAWQLAISTILMQIESLGAWRRAILTPALYRLGPAATVPAELREGLPMPVAVAALVIALWALLPLAAGAWRTATRDA